MALPEPERRRTGTARPHARLPRTAGPRGGDPGRPLLAARTGRPPVDPGGPRRGLLPADPPGSPARPELPGIGAGGSGRPQDAGPADRLLPRLRPRRDARHPGGLLATGARVGPRAAAAGFPGAVGGRLPAEPPVDPEARAPARSLPGRPCRAPPCRRRRRAPAPGAHEPDQRRARQPFHPRNAGHAPGRRTGGAGRRSACRPGALRPDRPAPDGTGRALPARRPQRVRSPGPERRPAAHAKRRHRRVDHRRRRPVTGQRAAPPPDRRPVDRLAARHRRPVAGAPGRGLH